MPQRFTEAPSIFPRSLILKWSKFPLWDTWLFIATTPWILPTSCPYKEKGNFMTVLPWGTFCTSLRFTRDFYWECQPDIIYVWIIPKRLNWSLSGEYAISNESCPLEHGSLPEVKSTQLLTSKWKTHCTYLSTSQRTENKHIQLSFSICRELVSGPPPHIIKSHIKMG